MQTDTDARNARFWDELCGSGLAQSIGVTDASPESLRRFDDAYMGIYPYLRDYVPNDFAGAPTLEIGLGYGTLSQLIAERGAALRALDLAEGPVAMVRSRLETAGVGDPAAVVQGSALDLPWDDGEFEYVFAIGCLHHTGDLPRAIREVRRVLRPGGTAVVMVYNRRSFQRLVHVPFKAALQRRRVGRRPGYDAFERAAYDANGAGQAAPHTDFVTRSELRRLFGSFANVDIRARNWSNLVLALPRRPVTLKREWFLGNLDRVWGTDLYVTARA